ncbi:MAG: hypothetical protein ACTSP4_08535 [Candidatus Hodarchaeales archaeon]
MLTIILYNCGFQLTENQEILNNPALQRVRLPSRINFPALLDMSVAHGSLKDPSMKHSGRPDIVHRSLLSVIDSPFWKKNDVKFIIHTINDEIWEIQKGWKPPVSYFRFYWLMERFLQEKRLDYGNVSMKLVEMSIIELISNLNDTNAKRPVFLLSKAGKNTGLKQLVTEIMKAWEFDPVIVIGGYQRGYDITELEKQLGNRVISSWNVSSESLRASTVLSMLFFGLEFLK